MPWWGIVLTVYGMVWFVIVFAMAGNPGNEVEVSKTYFAASFFWPLWALRFAWWLVLCMWDLACWICRRAWADWKAAGK